MEEDTNTTAVQDKDDAMRELIRKRLKAFNPYRRSKMLEINANIAYLCGHQNIEVVGGSLVPISDGYKTQVIANKILPAVVNDIAVATKAKTRFDVVPAGTDEDDKATAKAGDKILPYLLRINDPHLYRKSVVLWYDIAGCGWRKVYWCPYHHVIGENPLPGEKGYNENLQPLEPIFAGEVIVEHVPNTELVFDWRQKDLRKLKWIIHTKSITVSEITGSYGPDIDLPFDAIRTKNTDDENFEVSVMGEFAELSQSLVPETPNPDESNLVQQDQVINYYEFWALPDRNMPQGAYAVGIGDVDKKSSFKLLVNIPYPKELYPHKELPFIPAAPISLDGIAPGSISRISQARPLQREYNKLRSLILDNNDAMGNSVLIVAKGANVDFKKVTNGPGNYIEVDGPYASGVKREPGVPVSSSIFVHLELIRRDIDEIFAFHEPSKGIMPKGGPRSGKGLETLQEADYTQLIPMIGPMDEADERVAHQMLSLALVNYGERTIQILGKDNRWVLDKIDTAELSGKVNVIVRTGSSLPRNKAVEEQKTVSAWQMGLLGNPQDPSVRQRVLKAMDLGGMDQILEESAKQTNYAKREFINAEKLAQQMPPIPPEATEAQIKQNLSRFIFVPPVNDFDDHYVHQHEHGNDLLEKYYEYIGSGQIHLQILAKSMLDHLNMHNQAIFNQQLMMMQMQNPQLFQEKEQTKTKKKGT